MTDRTLIIVAIAVAIVAGLLAVVAGKGGPRVTQITTRREKKDRDDA